MNLLYLIRHGQAGPRDEYDRLSNLGREQAHHLGRWLASEGIDFDSVWTGGLRRQKETAALALEELAAAGRPQPEPQEDPRWSEFDLDAVYAGVAPRLSAVDAGFRTHYEALQRAIASGDGRIHRVWTPADNAVVESWIAGRFQLETESWEGFTERVRAAARERVAEAGSGRRVAVFTSATPVGISIGLTLPFAPMDILELAGSAINSNVTVLRVYGGTPRLLSFNGIAHLKEREMRSFR